VIQADSAIQNRIEIGQDFEKNIYRIRYGYPNYVDHYSQMLNQSFFSDKTRLDPMFVQHYRSV